MSSQNYPYLNFSPADLQGELWKDIPGLEGYFMVSSLGRIKRLAHTSVNTKGYSYSRSEMIISQTVQTAYNSFTGDAKIYLKVCISVKNKIYNFVVGRLVYYCFVEEFDMKDKSRLIFYKDNDGHNTSASNLQLGTLADKQDRMVSSGRRGTPFLDMSPEKRKLVQQKINEKRAQDQRHIISRYSLSGKLLETYHNAEIAAKAMKTNAGFLSKAARQSKVLTACGYLWRRGDAPVIEIDELLEKKRLRRSPLAKQQKNIGQYDMEGNLINSFSTIREAARVLKVPYSNIHKVIKGVNLTCKGFLWRESTKPKIRVSHLAQSDGFRKSRLSEQLRKVSQYNLEGIWIKTFNNPAEAAKLSGVDNKDITQVIKGRAISAGGFLWREGTALRINIRELVKHPKFKNSALDRYLKKKRLENQSRQNQAKQLVPNN